jgi:hypothetical protein
MSFQSGNNLSYTHKKLKAGEFTIRPFEINKLWKISTDNSEQYHYEKYDIKVYRAYYPENHKYFGNVANISSSLYERVFTTQSLDPKILWYYLDHNYYTEYRNEKLPSTITLDNQITYLSESASLFMIPVGVFGEGIREKSVVLDNYGSPYEYRLVDDGFGNLRDTAFDETKFVNPSYCLLYAGFNEKYREYNMKNNKLNYVLDFSSHRNVVTVKNTKKITYVPGIPISGSSTPTGVAAYLSGSYFRVDPNQNINFNFNKKQNFAFSFWINPKSDQPAGIGGKNYLFNKNLVRKVYKVNPSSSVHDFSEIEKESTQYPFDISYNNSLSDKPGKISFKQSSVFQTIEVTSSALSSNQWSHVLCQKSGSSYQIWLNGVLNSEVSGLIDTDTGNDNIFFIGGSTNTSSLFHGTLDEIRVYNSAISPDKIPYLYENTLNTGYAYQTSRVGNVFYGTGFMVISDPRPKYANAFLGEYGNYDYNGLTNGFRGEFRSTVTFYEYEVICKIRRGEFNFTQNPTVRVDKAGYSQELENYVTSSFFNPYITSVGLYDNDYNLVAVAKLANPLEKRDDVDINVIVRFDM